MLPDNNLEPRVAALEIRVDEVAVDVIAARDLAVKVDANRKVINALGVQTAARFDRVDERFDRVDQRFDHVEQRLDHVDQRLDRFGRRLDNVEIAVDANRKAINALGIQTAAGFARVDAAFLEVRGRLDQTAAGMEHIGNLLTVLIERDEK